MQTNRKEFQQTNSITDLEYRAFREYLEDTCGILLGENKQYLVTSRMRKVIHECKLATVGELIEEVKRGRNSTLKEKIVEAMTTNETSWFRDSQPFNVLKNHILPSILKNAPKRLRIWSAACSSGQEPYSIAMTLNEYQLTHPGVLPKDIEIIATDISPAMIKHATEGVYDEMNIVRGMSDERRQRYFKQVEGGWRVNDLVRKNIQFRNLNLLQSYALFGRFDLIFCRNVLIYFSHELKSDIVNRMAGTLNQTSYLLLGGSESMAKISQKFQMEKVDGTVLYKLL
ncbi:Chemotaxis protein methyltransferase CheR [hydrothermal vent metagenome]|uniref:protein-glutamate O-methyltransferase n=1 Tax=hydrothermal vent metagenome TaxID=652676 RepID=A0A3B0YZU6_9ZZZZ